MNKLLVWAAVLGCLAPSVSPASAVSVRSWSASNESELSAGSFDGTALDEEGRVVLAPAFRTLWGPDEGIVWAIRPAGAGAWVGLSGPGRVLRVSEGVEPEEWYRAAEERLVTALVADGEGVVFGLSPEGQVLGARSREDAELLVETGAKFIWTLALDDRGSLWIGTGLPGRVIRRGSDGVVETLFDAADDPIRCMAPLPGGGIVFGTGGRGLVGRIVEGGRPFVMLDAEEPEIAAVAAERDGTVYALGTRGAKQVTSSTQSPDEARMASGTAIRVVATPPPEEAPDSEEQRAEAEPEKRPPPIQTLQSPAGGAVYRLDRDGGTTKIWETDTEMPFALAVLGSGKLIVGTGDAGRIYTLDSEGRPASLSRVPSNQVSALAEGPGGSVLVGATTDARVGRIGPELNGSGTYLGPPVDAGGVADWGRLRWEADVPRGAALEVRVRGGNTAEPDDTWADWVSLRGEPGLDGAETGLGPSRFLQAEVEMSTGRGDSPVLRRLEAFYVPRNRPPKVRSLAVEPPGVVWIQGPAQPAGLLGPFVNDDPVTRNALAAIGRQPNRSRQMRKAYEAGARTFAWEAEDPDGDGLDYSLEIRREGREDWFPMAADLDEAFYSWDARAMPDGLYRVRLTAVDSADNPAGSELAARRISEVFVLDNTRPTVGDLEVRSVTGGYAVSFVATDPGGTVAAVEVAIEDGGWQPLDPVDGVADSAKERYELRVAADEAHTNRSKALMVRVTDGAGNLGGDLWVVPRR